MKTMGGRTSTACIPGTSPRNRIVCLRCRDSKDYVNSQPFRVLCHPADQWRRSSPTKLTASWNRHYLVLSTSPARLLAPERETTDKLREAHIAYTMNSARHQPTISFLPQHPASGAAFSGRAFNFLAAERKLKLERSHYTQLHA